MNIFLYIIIGIIGALFGSFFTLAVYRLPRGENITYKRSYCPKCGHRLEFLDLIPILSYIFLGGKCRYCKEPIHPRYILFELFTSAIYILLAFSMKLSIYSNINIFISYIYYILFISSVMISGLIVKEGHNVNKGVIIFGYIVTSIYLIVFERYSFITHFLVTLIYVLSLIILMYLFKKKFYILNCIFAGLIVYCLGVNVSIIVMAFALIYSIFKKYILKQNVIYIYYISMISILLVILNNIDVISYFLNFRWVI